jgi:GNAT superfamily N-acetyltransferase
MQLREATAADADFLLDMLVEACNWSGQQRVTRSDVGQVPQLRHYVSDWPRPDDVGASPLDDLGAPVGAAWARTFPANDPGFGFVAPDVPEMSIAVKAPQRGRGIGRRLIQALAETVRERGSRGLSLSVEDGNQAADLYATAVFRTVERHDNSTTMLLELPA